MLDVHTEESVHLAHVFDPQRLARFQVNNLAAVGLQLVEEQT